MLDLYRLLLLKKLSGDSGGGGDITLETLNVSQNGTTNAPSGTAYNKVVASVPNSYSAGDEGKVVSGGALVSQTAHAKVTTNGVIDTTLNNSVEVDVAGSSSGVTKLKEITISDSVSVLSITASEAMKKCNTLYIVLNLVLSASDWIYLYINATPGAVSSNQMGYLNKASTISVTFALVHVPQYGNFSGYYSYIPSQIVTNNTSRQANSLSEIDLRCYTSGVSITSGTVEIWGG
jgi:hypothetical protein